MFHCMAEGIKEKRSPSSKSTPFIRVLNLFMSVSPASPNLNPSGLRFAFYRELYT